MAAFAAPSTLIVAELFVGAGVIAAPRCPTLAVGPLLATLGALFALSFAVAEPLLPWRYTVGLASDDLATPVLALVARSGSALSSAQR